MTGNNDDHGPIDEATPVFGVSYVFHDVNQLTTIQWGVDPVFRIECGAGERTRWRIARKEGFDDILDTIAHPFLTCIDMM